jgi:hypothetical protein
MKTVIPSIVVAGILAASSAQATAVENRASIHTVTTKYQNLFAFKVSKAFTGALVEIYYSNGDLVASKSLIKRKMIINFCDVKPGTYTIKVKKNDRVEEFQFIRK